MAITKTKFINYVRCPRFCALDKIHIDKLEADVSLEDYRNEEKEQFLSEMLDIMIDEDGNDLIDEVNPQLEVMMPYYNRIELLAGKHVEGVFKNKAIYSADTLKQESFDFSSNGFKYLCYVDIYMPYKDAFNIVEVKATTSKNFLELGAKNKDKEFESIFIKNEEGIYIINKNSNLEQDRINKQIMKLYDKYNSCGKYIYDLAVQRYIVEQDLKSNGESNKINKIKYYLAVLNSDYVFSGKYEEEKPIYETDENGNDIITLFDMTDITFEIIDKIELDKQKLEKYILESKAEPYPLGKYCEYKKTTKCKYAKICYAKIPNENSILNYIDNHHGFKDENGNKYETYDLINDGMVNMLDVPYNYLNRVKNQIQYDVVKNKVEYINKNKIKDALKKIKYPIYHLDFETFPCPLPRFKGEKCYMQSVFQFSIHIEKEKGICHKDSDHHEFLISSHDDKREELVKALCDIITNFEGTVLTYNESFEKTRIKELAALFPEYSKTLNKISNMIFDLLYIVKTKSSLYEDLGYSEDESKLFNYYHFKLSGSFSIKKVLPLFSDLSYSNLDVANGNDAIITYANFPQMNKKEHNEKANALLYYCKQDTWAMVEILNKIIEKSK